jgi:hypothetical protein
VDRVGRRCASTRVGYGIALDQLADCFKVESADVLVARILSGELDTYVALERYLPDLAARELAPKTIRD